MFVNFLLPLGIKKTKLFFPPGGLLVQFKATSPYFRFWRQCSQLVVLASSVLRKFTACIIFA